MEFLFLKIRILQENISNDLLSDHEEGVLCQDDPQRILDVLRQNGFTLQTQTNGDDKASWTLEQTNGNSGDEGHQPVQPPAPNPIPSEDTDENAEWENQGEDEYYEEEINLQDISFLIWYFLSSSECFSSNKVTKPDFAIDCSKHVIISNKDTTKT